MTYRAVDFESNEFIFKQGEYGDAMYLIQNGKVEVLQEVGGQSNQVAILERGDFFGEMAVLEEEPRGHSVRALCPTRLISIDRSGLQAMLTRNTEIAVRMIRKLSIRLVSVEQMLMRAYAAADTNISQKSNIGYFSRAYLTNLIDNTDILLPGKSEIKIGRADPINRIFPDLDLTGIDSHLTTSRRHAILLRRNSAFYIQEEKATNGTFVNGQRISATQPMELCSGDDIVFGAVRMRFFAE